MGGLFGGGKTKTVATPVATVETPPAVEDAEVAVQNASDESRRRRGAAATILTGNDGAGTPNTVAKTLLGG